MDKSNEESCKNDVALLLGWWMLGLCTQPEKKYDPSMMGGDTLWIWLAFVLDILFGNSWNPAVDDVEPVVLSAARLHQYQTAQVLSLNVSDIERNPPQAFYPDFTVSFEDVNDQAMVTFMDGTCYGVFKGSARQMWDMSQSLGVFGSRRVCGSKGCCHLDRGMAGGYYGQFTDLFEEKMRECHSFCAGGCPVVLTGHSQGASISTIAAVALADINPMLFAFGAQKVLQPFRRCKVLDNMDTYYRTVAMCAEGGEPGYDINSYAGAIFGRNTGTMILLGHGGAATMARNKDRFLLPFIRSCHDIRDPYIFSIMKLTPGPLDGFVDGSLCTRHIECKSKNCVNKRCSA